MKLLYCTAENTFLSKWRSSQYVLNLSSRGKSKPELNSGLNGNRTHDLCDTSAAMIFICLKMYFPANYLFKQNDDRKTIIWIKNLAAAINIADQSALTLCPVLQLPGPCLSIGKVNDMFLSLQLGARRQQQTAVLAEIEGAWCFLRWFLHLSSHMYTFQQALFSIINKMTLTALPIQLSYLH